MKEIKCCCCQKPKSEEGFSWSNKTKCIRNHRCKDCQKKYTKKHYVLNKTNYLDTQRMSRDRNKLFICNYLKDHPCVDCDEKNIVVLQFDHKDPTIKYENMSKAINDKWGINKLKNEIKKCDIRCANCHFKKHARENESFKFLFERTFN